MVRVTASSGGRSLDRESITSSHTEVPINVYRVTNPPIFAGFQITGLRGSDSETGTTFEINSGAGLGSKYATLRVTVPGHSSVHEYIDITELLAQRVTAIINELTAQKGNEQ